MPWLWRHPVVAHLVVVVAILVVGIVSLARLPSTSATAVLGTVVGALVAVIGGLVTLIARPSNSVQTPKTPPDAKQ